MASSLLCYFTKAALYLNPDVMRGNPYEYGVRLYTANAATAYRLKPRIQAAFLALGMDSALIRVATDAEQQQSPHIFISGSKREIQTILGHIIGQKTPETVAARFLSDLELMPVFR